MKIDALKDVLPPKAIDVLKRSNIEELNEPQRLAVESGLLDGKSVVVASPTASGKTLIAELAAIDCVLNQGKKAVYIVPLKALAMEKYREFKEKYTDLGIDVAVSIGNFDSADRWLQDKDIIIMTSEKLDASIRHGIPWMDRVGLVVVDEIHLLNDASRGPTLEVTMTRLRQRAQFRILGLSATISNAEELADWLDAELVYSEYRPVELKQGVYYGDKMIFKDTQDSIPESGDPVESIVSDVLRKGKQALVFVSSRRSAESVAERLGRITRNHKGSGNLGEVEDDIMTALSKPTKQCKRLANCVSRASAFHHAGLVHKQRTAIEDAFRDGRIKIISATPTLAAGVNIPAHTVVIRDTTRFQAGIGAHPIPVLEYQQMAGRAGRPKYDTEGVSLAVAKKEPDVKDIFKRYIKGKPEDIYSKLSLEPVLRTHVLSLIVTGDVRNEDDLESFMAKTFYAHQYENMEDLAFKVRKVLRLLWDYGMIDFQGKNVIATRLGKRVSELYLDPETAHMLITAIRQPMTTDVPENLNRHGAQSDFQTADAMTNHEKVLSTFGIVHLLTTTIEMKPGLRIKTDEREEIANLLEEAVPFIITEIPSTWDWGFAEFLKTIKTTTMLEAWMNERGEDELMEKFGVAPGELRVKLDNADWLCYSLEEFARIFKLKDIHRTVAKTRARLRYGVKEDLLDLVKIKGIGRVRARKLKKAGITKKKDLETIQEPKLAKLVGPKTARNIKAELGFGEHSDSEDAKRTQRRLGHY